jgi:hypothetical protein
MSGAAFLRVKKLKGGGIITAAARHNKREIQAELGATGSIDPTRSCLNYAIAGPSVADDVGQLAKDLMRAAGLLKLRKDAVMGLEAVFSLPPDTAIDDRAYFTDCAQWLGGYLGGSILSVDVHWDEAAPHCHVLLLPLVGGRMVGNKLLGGKQMLMAMQKDFHLKVASRYGMSKAPARLTGSTKQAASKAVLQHLRDTADPVLKSSGWPAYRDAIEAAPAPFLLAYGLELAAPEKKLRTFTQIMTSKGKGPAKEKNAIAFALPEKEQRLCPVAIAPKPACLSPPPAARQLPHRQPAIDLPEIEAQDDEEHDLDAVRDRDEDHDPALYDPDTGEYFRPPPPPARRHRQAADGWVRSALMTKTTGAAAARP